MNPVVHWGEGIFLQPHHFQSSERYLQDEIARSEEWFEGYSYGLRRIEFDEDALLNWEFRITSCEARFRDGSHMCFPQNAELGVAKIPETAFDNREHMLVFLLLPRLQLGRQNVADETPSDARYFVDTTAIEDENQAGRPCDVMIRRFNARVSVGDKDEEFPGFEVLPIARLKLGAGSGAAPVIDTEYIPPILCCDAWPYLREQLLHGIFGRVNGNVRNLSTQVMQQKVDFETGHREDFLLMFQLYAWNIALGSIWNLPHVRGVHPLSAYTELCRIVGSLAAFREDRRMPELPVYDHDNLGFCFHEVSRLIEVPKVKQPTKRPFTVSGLQLEVDFEKDWLTPQYASFIGVECELPFREVDQLLQRDLKMKLASSNQVDRIFQRGMAGVNLTPELQAPRVLPSQNWSYWRVDQSSTAWSEVEQTLRLGLRIDDRQTGRLSNGQQVVEVRTRDGKSVVISFALWVVDATNEK